MSPARAQAVQRKEGILQQIPVLRVCLSALAGLSRTRVSPPRSPRGDTGAPAVPGSLGTSCPGALAGPAFGPVAAPPTVLTRLGIGSKRPQTPVFHRGRRRGLLEPRAVGFLSLRDLVFFCLPQAPGFRGLLLSPGRALRQSSCQVRCGERRLKPRIRVPRWVVSSGGTLAGGQGAAAFGARVRVRLLKRCACELTPYACP